MEAFFILLFFVAPLIPLPIALWVHGCKWDSVRWPARFSIIYALLQGLAYYYCYCCFSRGYEDALYSLIVPWGIAFLALPTSWLFFLFSFPDRKRPETTPQAS